MGKKKGSAITIVDRSAPRISIQITEILVDPDKKTRHRESVAHFTVTNLTGAEAKKIVLKAIEKAGSR